MAETITLTEAEKVFIARMAHHVAAGLDFEAAGRAVLDDDVKIYNATFAERGGEYIGGNFTAGRATARQANPVRQALARHVYETIRSKGAQQ